LPVGASGRRLNFDAKLRRQSSEPTDLFHAHVGGIDTLARALLAAADMVEHQTLAAPRKERYGGLVGDLGKAILSGSADARRSRGASRRGGIDPRPRSGQQELLESLVNRRIWAADGVRETGAEEPSRTGGTGADDASACSSASSCCVSFVGGFPRMIIPRTSSGVTSFL